MLSSCSAPSGELQYKTFLLSKKKADGLFSFCTWCLYTDLLYVALLNLKTNSTCMKISDLLCLCPKFFCLTNEIHFLKYNIRANCMHIVYCLSMLSDFFFLIGNPHSYHTSSRLTHDTVETVRYRWSQHTSNRRVSDLLVPGSDGLTTDHFLTEYCSISMPAQRSTLWFSLQVVQPPWN